MDFCIGTVMFILIGFGLLLGEDALGGFLGLPTLGIFTGYDTQPYRMWNNKYQYKLSCFGAAFGCPKTLCVKCPAGVE